MATNQRNYYRILDTVALEYRLVPDNKVPDIKVPDISAPEITVPQSTASATSTTTTNPPGKNPEDFFELTTGFALLGALNAIDQEHAAFARSLHERERELAGYLRGMNRKIELIAHAIALGGQDIGKLPRFEVSLSEGGIAFDSPQTFMPGQMLAVKITLLPRLTTIISYARVVDCVAVVNRVAVVDDIATGNLRAFTTSLEFVDMDEPQRQLLARHILRAQSQQQRKRQAEQTAD